MALNKLTISYPDFKLLEIIDPEQFDTNNNDIKLKIDQVIDVLNKITDSVADGGSGADAISLTSIAPFTSTKLQVFLEEVIGRLQSTTDASSGADFVASTSIAGVTGSTVQAQLESLKTLLDKAQADATKANSDLATHKASGDHDGRYYTKTLLDGGQLDGRYYTRSQLDGGQLDNRYYREAEVDAKVSGLQTQITSNDGDITALQGRATALESDVANRYTKAETDTKVSGVQSQIDALNNTYSTDAERIQAISDVIDQFEIADDDLETLINNKANKTDVYTIQEANALLSNKANVSDVYTKGSVDTLLSAKTSLTGNHEGTWQGLTPGEASEAVNGGRIDVIEANLSLQNATESSLTPGVNVVEGDVASTGTLEVEGRTLASSGNSDLKDNAYYVLADKLTKVKAFIGDTWKQGVAKFQRPTSVTSTADFTGKVSGSTMENPHVSKRSLSSPASTVLEPPSNLTTEMSTSHYDLFKTLDTSLMSNPTVVNGGISQQLFSFNIIAQIERKHGQIPAVDKVQWVKDNVSKLTCNWHGKGSSSSGNEAKVSYWNGSTWYFYEPWINTENIIKKVTIKFENNSQINALIRNDGFAHFLAYAPASDGVTPSVIETKYVSLDVELKPTAQLVKRPVFSTIGNFEGKVSGSVVENPHVAKRIGNQTTLQPPVSTWVEFTDGYLNPIMSLDGINSSQNSLYVDGIGQHLFSFDIVQQIERKLGSIPRSTLADKVQWCKDNVSKLKPLWVGYGNSPTGNKATIRYFNGGSWGGFGSHTSNAPTGISSNVFDHSFINTYNVIQSDGFAHFLTHAEPSDGVTASTIHTNYVECEIELKPEAELLNPTVPLYEVTQGEYDKILVDWNEASVLSRYPRTTGVQHVVNPYVEAEGENLLPPFDEWTLHANAKVLSPYELELNATGTDQFSKLNLNLLTNQTYSVKSSGSARFLIYENAYANKLYDSSVNGDYGSFTTPSSIKDITVIVTNSSYGNGIFICSQPMLTLGSEAKPFVPRNPSRLYTNTTLRSVGDVKDVLFYEDGVYKKRKNVEHVVLDGSLAWYFQSDQSGFKRVTFLIGGTPTLNNVSGVCIKYNGKSLTKDYTVSDGFRVGDGVANNPFYVTLPDTDTGWGEGYTPTADEIKAYFYGWKMQENSTGAPYNGTGTKGWVDVRSGGGGTTTLPTGFRDDAFTPYQLTYVLASPVEEEVVTEGTPVISGETQVTFSTGYVHMERATPTRYLETYLINDKNDAPSKLNHKTKKIVAVYENGSLFTKWTMSDGNAYGKEKVIIQAVDYKPDAIYEVSYTVDSGVPVESTLYYTHNLRTAHNELVRQVGDVSDDVSALKNAGFARKEQNPWLKAVLSNAWVANGDGAHYMRDEFGFIHLRGQVASGTSTAWTVVFTLPEGYRPKENFYQLVRGYTGTTEVTAFIRIDADGGVKITSGNGTLTSLDLSGIVFKAK
jgi:hypothetical protein